MNIRLGFGCAAALLIAMMFASCTKEELFSAPVKKSDEINFGVNLKWDDHEVSTRSGVDYGNRAGSFMLRSEDSADSLAVNVYVKNTISESAPMTKGSVVENADAIADFDVYCSLDNGSETVPYFLNLEATQENGFWKPARDCYWPGSDFTKLKFLAVAPYEHGMTSTIASGSVMPTSFSYTVPEAAVKQNDIMMAVTGEYAGNYNQTVPVTFNHLLSAINVKIGSVPEGTIHSITLKGVGSSSTYTVADGTWATCTATDDFAVHFAGDGDTFATTGAETGNPQINAAKATFMMIPQTLGENAYLEVVFTHTITNNNVRLTASLANVGWEKSKTYNYLINIEPDFILNIVEENIPIADCHYDVREITISDAANAGWILTSNVDWVKFRVKPSDYETYEYKDHWIENHNVIIIDRVVDLYRDENATDNRSSETTNITENSIARTIQGKGTQSVIVYFYENLDDSVDGIRNSSIKITDLKGNERDNIDVYQYSPLWLNNKTFERIEEDIEGYIWGFSSNRTVIYSYPNIEEINWGGLQWLWDAIVLAHRWNLDFLGLYDYFIGDRKASRGDTYKAFYDTYIVGQTNGFATISPSGGDGTAKWAEDKSWSVKLDYSKLTNIDASSDSGLTNTITIMNYVGATEGSDAETWLESNGMVKGTETNAETESTTLPRTAAYQAVKKNRFIATTTIVNTKTYIEHPTNKTEQEINESKATNAIQLADAISWFLPSKEEFELLGSTANIALSGIYWTSTSLTGGSSSYYYNNGATNTGLRTNKYKIRAARMKP